MKSYKIINRSGGSIFLEDIGVRLPSPGASAVINEAQYTSSRSLREMAKFLDISLMSNIPFWPFSNPRPVQVPQTTKPHTPTPVASNDEVKVVVSAPIEENKDPTRISLLEQKHDNLLNKIDSLIDVLSSMKMPSALNIENTKPFPEISSDPLMFIPSKIVPTESEIQLKSTKEEQERVDIDEATKSLKKLRKKNKS